MIPTRASGGTARRKERGLVRCAAAFAVLLLGGIHPALAANACTAERAAPLLPADPATCSALEPVVRDPSGLPLATYQARLNEYLGNYCHRNAEAGWQRDKRVRDTGPFTATLTPTGWTGAERGTHGPVVIWYSPEMADWIVRNRPADQPAPEDPEPVPAGAVIVKEMFSSSAGVCAGVDPARLFPVNGAAIMIRDPGASKDGWYWGWYGFGSASGWAPDWPPAPTNPLPNQGFAQYCLNCHASARDNSTFSAADNLEGQPGEPLVFLSQDFFEKLPSPSHHEEVTLPGDTVRRLGSPHYRSDRALLEALRAYAAGVPDADTVTAMPSQTYDNTFVAAGGPTAADTFLTSSQCIGCHDAGSTGLQFDMTEPNPHGEGLLNLSPYATWRSSPMGLAGRDPFFFAQLASETESFHPAAKGLVEDTCLGCHGIAGQRQFHIDTTAATGACEDFTRPLVDAVPFPADNPSAADAKYGMLARDGITCTACHRMALGERAEGALTRPENACVEERQALLNPDNTGFARTFTGSFAVGPPDALIGPFAEPRQRPMQHALGISPQAHDTITSSEVCGTCHTVHLPILSDGKIVGQTYEQTTYPEWAFSKYRTGTTPDGPLPLGRGSDPQSCQDCHMPSTNAAGEPRRSKVASIQEFSNFPAAEHTLPPEEIDLPVRDFYSVHTLVGLNVFLVKMAQQFPDVLGIRTRDPMLGAKGVDPLVRTEQAMLDLAATGTADLAVEDLAVDDDRLVATVSVTSRVGHKFPSGVGFRRAFLTFTVRDENGEVLWASGRTNAAGILVDEAGEPIRGEMWWNEDCSARINPDAREHQPHYQRITRQDEAQIYQELVSTPPEGVAAPQCGHDVAPAGRLTTSFLSICTPVKDNRILPAGFLTTPERRQIAAALGADPELAVEAGSHAVDGDEDYATGGGDSLVYDVPLSSLPPGRTPASVEATLYYQATPPFYLQDRFCTSRSQDTQRLGFLVGRLNLDGTPLEDWKLRVVSTGPVRVE